MKKTLKLTALFLLISGILFGASPTTGGKKSSPKDVVTFRSLPAQAGVDIKVKKHTPGKVMVIVYDQYSNMVRNEVLPPKKTIEKRFVLSKLDNGKYTIEVVSNKITTRKDVQVNNGQCKLL